MFGRQVASVVLNLKRFSQAEMYVAIVGLIINPIACYVSKAICTLVYFALIHKIVKHGNRFNGFILIPCNVPLTRGMSPHAA